MYSLLGIWFAGWLCLLGFRYCLLFLLLLYSQNVRWVCSALLVLLVFASFTQFAGSIFLGFSVLKFAGGCLNRLLSVMLTVCMICTDGWLRYLLDDCRLCVLFQEAKYVECWPNTTSASAGWRRFNIPVDKSDGAHSLLHCTS
jgi:hypothetical protein